jgi:predicted transcriptional regulator
MARPRKGEEKNAPIHLGFRVTEWVRAGLDRLAEKRGSAISDIANEALAEYLERHGITPDQSISRGLRKKRSPRTAG